MSSNPQIPPLVQEQLARLQQNTTELSIHYDAKTQLESEKT